MPVREEMVPYACQEGDGSVCLSGRRWCRMPVRKEMVPHAYQNGKRLTCVYLHDKL